MAPISFYRLGKMLDDVSQKYNRSGAKMLSSMSSGADYYTDCFPPEWLSPPVEAEFEGRSYFIPRDCDSVLKKCYGDYMTPVKPSDLTKNPELLSVLDVCDEEKERREFVVGYTTGVFDLFHIGHLNILKKAKESCDYLIVGVTTDELAFEYKKIKPVIPFDERCEIIKAVKYVDKVVPQTSMDKLEAYDKYRFDVMFVGDDWKGTDKWNALEKEFERRKVKIIYFPYTKSTSSTKLRAFIDTNKEKNR